jgi:hypothetical protein
MVFAPFSPNSNNISISPSIPTAPLFFKGGLRPLAHRAYGSERGFFENLPTALVII